MSTQKNQKGFAPILIVIAIVVIGGLIGGTYFLGKQANKSISSPELTANWITYTNITYHYSLSYKPNPKLKQLTCSNDIFILDELNSSIPECGYNEYRYPIQIFIDTYRNLCQTSVGVGVNEQDIIVSGIKGQRCDFTHANKPDDFSSVQLKYGDKFFNFYLTNKNYSETFNQILSTFRLIN